MAEVILNLPMHRSKYKSKHHDLFLKVSDGQVWKIGRGEYKGDPQTFRASLRGWAEHRELKVETRIDGEGNVCVRMSKID